MFSIGACGDTEPPRSNSADRGTTTKRHTLDHSGMTLGEGFNAPLKDGSAPADERYGTPTGKICIQKEVQRELVDDMAATSFYVYSDNEVTRELRDNTKGRFDLTEADEQTLTDHYDQYNLSNSTKTVLSILVDVSTLRRMARPDPTEGSPTEENICDAGDPGRPADFEEFIQKCGTSYLKERTKGGYILFTSEVSNLSRESKIELDRAANVGAGPKSAKTALTIMDNIAALGFSVKFDVSTTVDSWDPKHATSGTTEYWPDWGNTVYSAVLNSEGKFEAFRWNDYRFFLRKFDSSNDNQRDGYLVDYKDTANLAGSQTNPYNPDHPRYGDKKTQTFSRYYQSDLEDCEITDVEFDKYQCYADFSLENQWLLDSDESPVEDMARRAQWKLNNPGRVRWAAQVDDTKAEYQDAVDQYNECLKSTSSKLTTLEERRQECQSQFQSGNYSSLCTICSLDPSDPCSQESLRSKFDRLPSSPVVPPSGEGTPGANYPNYTAPIVNTQTGTTSGTIASKSKYLCALARMEGKFSSTDEKIRLTSNSSNWNFATATSHDHIRGAAVCAERDIFFDTDSSTWLAFRNDKAAISSSGSSTTTLWGEKYAASLAGLSGAMAGGGEYGRIELDSGQDKLHVHSQQGAMEAYASSFGLDSPKNEPPRGYLVSKSVETNGGAGGHVTKRLDFAADEGICFLTRVEGEFDGMAEHARVFRRDQHWHVQVRAACESCSFANAGECFRTTTCGTYKNVQAEARCYHFDQQN